MLGNEKTNSSVPLPDISRWTVSPYICVFFFILKKNKAILAKPR